MGEIRDDNGEVVKAGDLVSFSYGIPPTGVLGRVVDRNGKLFILTPEANPKECAMSLLRSYVGSFYIDRTIPAADHESAKCEGE